MRVMTDGSIDLIEELQLRRWARENYVPPEGRDDSWHPVVREEMRKKDAELEKADPSTPRLPIRAPLAQAVRTSLSSTAT